MGALFVRWFVPDPPVTCAWFGPEAVIFRPLPQGAPPPSIPTIIGPKGSIGPVGPELNWASTNW